MNIAPVSTRAVCWSPPPGFNLGAHDLFTGVMLHATRNWQVSPGEDRIRMVSNDELVRRQKFYFRKTPVTTLHEIVTVRIRDIATESEKSFEIMVGWMYSMENGFKHAFILAPSMDFDFRIAARAKFPINNLNNMLNGVNLIWWNNDKIIDDRGNFKNAPFTNRVYVFTDVLNQDKNDIKAAFREQGLEAIIIDDQRWKFEFDKMPADVFICHDSRDKPRYARPLYDELVRRNLKVWLDEFAIKPGNDFVDKIDRGLATSRHALLLLTRRFLQNDRWASHEMSALLNRQFNEGREDLIIPLYIGVTPMEVQKRSPLLAKAFAVRASALKFPSQVKRVASEVCRTVQPGFAQ
jgi:TIR domain